MRARFVVMALVAIGCAGPRVETAVSPVTGNSCDAPRVPAGEQEWREVAGDGFTYCVPASWRPIGSQARHWHAADVDFAWADRPPHPVDRRVPFGGRSPEGPVMVSPVVAEGIAAQTQVVYSEQVNGRTIRLTMEHPAGRHVRSSDDVLVPALTAFASARTAHAASEILAVYRSVRFVGPS